MKMRAREFLDWPEKSITLVGMSGVGKSFLSSKLEEWGWFNYSCDHLIGTKYLADHVSGEMSADNILSLSEFVGQIGNPDKGGVLREEFQRRQKMYYDAECAVLRDLPEGMAQARKEGFTHFVNDSSGSLCEVEDESIIEGVGQSSLVVYLRVRQEDHSQILERAIQYPKPLFFPTTFFDERLEAFKEKFEVEDEREIDPDVFLSWVFPHLFESRLPKYKALAEKYGVSISPGAFSHVKTEDDFLNVIAGALGSLE